jgi:hypothetical protein
MHQDDWRVYSRTAKHSVLEREIHHDSLISDMRRMYKVWQQADLMATREAIMSMAAYVPLPEQTDEEVFGLDTSIFGDDSESTDLDDSDSERELFPFPI